MSARVASRALLAVIDAMTIVTRIARFRARVLPLLLLARFGDTAAAHMILQSASAIFLHACFRTAFCDER